METPFGRRQSTGSESAVHPALLNDHHWANSPAMGLTVSPNPLSRRGRRSTPSRGWERYTAANQSDSIVMLFTEQGLPGGRPGPPASSAC